jgi:hypothetical protein
MRYRVGTRRIASSTTFRLTGIDHAFAVAEVAAANELLALVTGLPHGTSGLTSDASFRA